MLNPIVHDNHGTVIKRQFIYNVFMDTLVKITDNIRAKK